MKYLLFGIVWLGWTAVSIYAVGLIWTSVKSKEYRVCPEPLANWQDQSEL